MNPPTLSEALEACGYRDIPIPNAKPGDAGRRRIVQIPTGDVVGDFDAFEAWAWLERP